MADVPASVRTLAADRRFTRLRPAGGGVEFQVFEATAPDGSKVVLRTPVGGRFQSSPNDRDVDTRSLLRWVLAGYREPVPVDSAAFWIYRLDAAPSSRCCSIPRRPTPASGHARSAGCARCTCGSAES